MRGRASFTFKVLPPIDDWSTYQFYYRDAVTYWIDSSWITEGELRAAEAAASDRDPSN